LDCRRTVQEFYATSDVRILLTVERKPRTKPRIVRSTDGRADCQRSAVFTIVSVHGFNCGFVRTLDRIERKPRTVRRTV
jgi:hypothetical protein